MSTIQDRTDSRKTTTAAIERPSRGLQEDLMALLAQSTEYGQLVANSIDIAMFEGDYQIIAQRFVKYWKQYKRPPGARTLDLFGDIVDSGVSQKGANIRRVVMGLAGLAEGVNIEYVLNTLHQFQRVQSLKDAVIRAAQTLGNNPNANVAQVEEILSGVLRVHNDTFPGRRRVRRPAVYCSSIWKRASITSSSPASTCSTAIM